MSDKKARKRLTRAETVTLKTAKLDILLDQSKDTTVKNEESSAPDAGSRSDDAGVSEREESGRAQVLKAEMRLLREQLAQKADEYRHLVGESRTSDSKVVQHVIALLSNDSGITKARLIQETGAKKGYVDALLNRILPSKGHSIVSVPIAGERARIYRLSSSEAATASQAIESDIATHEP